MFRSSPDLDAAVERMPQMKLARALEKLTVRLCRMHGGQVPPELDQDLTAVWEALSDSAAAGTRERVKHAADFVEVCYNLKLAWQKLGIVPQR